MSVMFINNKELRKTGVSMTCYFMKFDYKHAEAGVSCHAPVICNYSPSPNLQHKSCNYDFSSITAQHFGEKLTVIALP